MQPSDELKNLVLQIYNKEASGGLFDFARRVYSQHDDVLLIGSEPDDRYEGYDAIIRFYEAAGAAGLDIRVDDLIAVAEGAFGWVVDRVIARLPNGTEIPVRHTYIFHREDSGWKIMHAHISVGIPDETLSAIFSASAVDE